VEVVVAGAWGGDVRWSEAEEREALHYHECTECGESWEHESRMCEQGVTLKCDDCLLAMPEPGKKEGDPTKVPTPEEEPVPIEEPPAEEEEERVR
jgi:predicted RNA-binding Zn-ribbon protein involved in translation (DUF1610 family)